MTTATVNLNDWDGNQNLYADVDEKHPLLLAMLTCEQWVSSDADLARSIKLLAAVQLTRLEMTH